MNDILGFRAGGNATVSDLRCGAEPGQEKTFQILTHVTNQEKECKAIKSLLESHNQGIAPYA
jgi:hypothetical protein